MQTSRFCLLRCQVVDRVGLRRLQRQCLSFELPTLSSRGFRILSTNSISDLIRDTSYVVVGDRAGHVCRYAVVPTNECGYTDITGEASSYEGEPLSGTISMVLDVAMSNNGRYMFVADRDEKIRVSRYPEAYVIQSFCLGHSAYVSSIAVDGDHLFSSGGDGFVHEWDVESGTSLAQSQKLGEEPIRRIRVCKKDNKVCLAAITRTALTLLDEKLTIMKSFNTADSLMDITPFKGHIIGVCSNGVVLFDLSDGTSRSVEVPNELLERLSKSKDPISSYFKNVTHQNMLDYYKRKAEKIESTKGESNSQAESEAIT
ncbi:WD domain, G-beta repeat protein [Ostertagia ostertagi]